MSDVLRLERLEKSYNRGKPGEIAVLKGIDLVIPRGQVVALYYMSISLAGLLLGPTTVGTLSTRLFGEGQLHLAVAIVPVVYGIIPLAFAVWRLRRR